MPARFAKVSDTLLCRVVEAPLSTPAAASWQRTSVVSPLPEFCPPGAVSALPGAATGRQAKHEYKNEPEEQRGDVKSSLFASSHGYAAVALRC